MDVNTRWQRAAQNTVAGAVLEPIARASLPATLILEGTAPIKMAPIKMAQRGTFPQPHLPGSRIARPHSATAGATSVSAINPAGVTAVAADPTIYAKGAQS